MPPLPGEEHLLTLFADIHYFFTAPTPKTLYHRFDKDSYLYIYHDASQHRTRIEVANNPGTPDQDAFYGALDHVQLRHSILFPTRCTLIVDGQRVDFPPPPSADPYEWRLPINNTPDGTNELLRLHTLDIYFHMVDDANQFFDAIGKILSPGQIESDRVSLPDQPNNSISSVVQQLENVAVTDPAYQNGQTRNSRSEPTSSSAGNPQNVPGTSTLPPPPPGGPPASTQSRPTTTGSQSPAEEQKEPVNFTPLPYNPAAPAAPEPIKHREKTPPPVDAADGTGLAAAAAADYGIPYTPPSQLPGGYAAPPPSSQTVPYSHPGTTSTTFAQKPAGTGMTHSTSFSSPTPSAGLTHTTAFPSQSSIMSPVGVLPYSTPFSASTAGQSSLMSFAPPPQDPSAYLYGQQQQQQQQQQQHTFASQPQPQAQSQTQPPHPRLQRQQTAPPLGGYSNYSYQQAPRHHHNPSGSGSEYDIHSQVYRPTQEEAGSHHQKYAQKAMKNPGQRGRKLEEGASRMESSVNKFLKRLDKKI